MEYPEQPDSVKENVRLGTFQPILTAAASHNALVMELSADKQEALWRRIIDTFGDGEIQSPFPFFAHGKHILDVDAWLWIDEFLKDKSDIVLIFNNNFLPMLRFANGADVIPVLRSGTWGHPMFEFYLSNVNADFLMLYDHEHALYTAGRAADWLKRVLNEVYEYIGAPPETLLVTEVHTPSFGEEIVLDCLYDQQSRLPVRLVFKACNRMDLQVFSAKKPEANVQFIYLGRWEDRGRLKPKPPTATIRTSNFSLKATYKELVAEKDW